ncbi:outer membrane beta-barrel protein [Endozoicomonas sp. ALB091]|uniref:outer membrane beta-barrel protein n=1 Tax=Endozoicomonas sp. ALB091 TaxID=3403073 RepID=UPI003BB7E3B6
MRKKLLSVVIANVIGLSGAASADEFTDFLRQANNGDNLSASNEGINLSGHFGSSIEYETKTTTNWGYGEIKEKIITNEIGNVFLNIQDLGLRANYSLKTMSREQKNYDTSGAKGYYENEDSLKHLILLDRPFALSGGWGTGLGYEAEYITSEVVSSSANHHEKNSLEQIIRPYLTYWNNNYNAGFYASAEYLDLSFDNGSWGTTDEGGYSLMFKPYKNYGNFQFELELFYQVKDDNETVHAGGVKKYEFTEKYIQPTIRYSIDNAGLVYLTTRFTKNETTDKGAGPDYFKDVVKTSIGYETDLGENWMVKAEYEYTYEKETTNDPREAGLSKKVDNHKFYAHALYRF